MVEGLLLLPLEKRPALAAGCEAASSGTDAMRPRRLILGFTDALLALLQANARAVRVAMLVVLLTSGWSNAQRTRGSRSTAR